MSFLKKVGKLAKKGVQAYAAYQTGGLSAVATKALSKKVARAKAAPMAMSTMLSSKYGGGITAVPASFVGTAAKTALKSLPYIGTAVTAADLATTAYGAFAGKKPRLTKDGRMTMRKRHTINPANVKALRRSIRRIKGAEKLFRTVLSVQGKAHAGIKPKNRKR